MKVSPFDAELNSETNGLVFMDGTYSFKKFLVENLFHRGSSVVLASHRLFLYITERSKLSLDKVQRIDRDKLMQ